MVRCYEGACSDASGLGEVGYGDCQTTTTQVLYAGLWHLSVDDGWKGRRSVYPEVCL